MAELTYKVNADWSQLEKLREEIVKTVAQMKQLKPDSPTEEFEKLIRKHADLQNQYNDILASMGRVAFYAQEAFKKVGDAVKDELAHIGDLKTNVEGLTSATEKRLVMEEKVNEVIRKMRDNVKAQKNSLLGQDEQSQEWKEINEQLFVYDQMLEASNTRLENLRSKVKDVSEAVDEINVDKIEETIEKLTSDKDTIIDDLRDKANDSIDNLNKLCDSAEKLEESLSNNKGKTFDEIKQETEEYGDTLQKVSDAAGDAIKEQEAYIQGLHDKLDELTEKANSTNDKTILTELNKQADELTFGLQSAEVTLEHLKRVKDDVDVKITDFQEVRETVSAFDELNQKMEQYGKILDNVKMGTEEATEAFEEYADKTTSMSEDIKGSLKSIAAIAGVAFGLSEIKGFISNVASTREYFQDIESSMKVFLGNAEKSAEFTNKLKDYAWFNMFEFSDLAKASQQMIAYGQDVDTIIPKLDMLSNIAAGTHAPLMEMVDAYNRAKSTGVVDAMGIRSWATKGVVIKDVLREMGEQASTTQITFEQLNRVLEHLTGDGGMFHDLMKEQLNNISAEKGQLEDNLSNMYNEIGEKLQGAITKWYKLQSDMVDNYTDIAGGEKVIDFVVNVSETGMDLLMDNWKQLMELIKNAIAIYGSWRVALLAVSSVHKIQVALWKAEAAAANINSGAIVSNTIVKGEATAATVLLDKATKSLNTSMLASPLTWWAAGIAAVVYGIYTWVTAESSLEKGTRQANSELERQSELLDERKNNINNLIGVIKDQNQTEYAQYEAYRKLKAIAPEITNLYNRQQIAAMELDDVQKLLNKDLADNKYEQAKQNVEEYTKKVEEMQARYDKYHKSTDNAADYSYAPDYVSSDMLNTAIYQLQEYKKALEEIEETRKNALREEEDTILGDEKLIEIGEAYKNIDEKAKNYTKSVIAAGTEMKQFGDLSIEQANEIAKKHGLTAENIKKDFGDAFDVLDKDIDTLQKSLNEVSDPAEKRKIELEIARKQEQLNYIDNIRTQLNDIVRNPYQLRLNFVGKAQKWLMQLLKLAGFDVPADLEGNVEEQREKSQTAQSSSEKAKERYNKPRKSSKEYIEQQQQEEKKKASDYRAYKSGKGKIKIQGTEYNLEKLTVDENAKLEQYFKGADALLKKGEKEAKEAMQRRQKDYDQFLKKREQQLEQEKNAENAAAEARIASIENANNREQAERQNQFRQRKQQIDAQVESFKKANVELMKAEWQNKKENKDKIWADTATAQDIKKNGYANIALTSAQSAQIEAERDKAAFEENRYNREQLENRKKAMNEFLKEFGNTEEQRLAIVKEYEQKIREARTEGDRLTLQAQERQTLQKFDNDKLAESLKFEDVFNNLGELTLDRLEQVRSQLRQMLSNNDLDFQNYKAIAEQIAKVNDAILEKEDKENEFLGFRIPREETVKRLKEEQAEALNQQTQAQAMLTKANLDLTTKKYEVGTMLSGMGVDISGKDLTKANTQQNLDKVAAKYGTNREQYKRASKALEELAAAEEKVTQNEKKKEKADENANNVSQRLSEALKDVRKRVGEFAESLQQVNANIQALPGLMDSLGLGDTGAGQMVAGIADAANNAMGAMADFASGNYVGAAMKGITAIDGLGETIGLWSHSNRAEIEKENKRLATAMSVNTEAINRLTEAMKNQSPDEAYQSYEQALRAMQANQQASLQTMLNNLSMYDHGHSLGYDFYQSSGNRQLVKEIFDYLKVDVKKYGGSYGLGELLQIDPQTLNKLYKDNKGQDLLSRLMVAINDAEDKGNYNGLYNDILSYLNDFSKDAFDELKDSFQEAVTSISFDSMYSSFVSSLMDMDKKAVEFTQDFEGYLRTAIYEAMLSSEDGIKPMLQNWYKAFASAMKSKEKNGKYLSDKEIKELMKTGGTTAEGETFMGFEQIRDSALELRKSIEELGLYNGKNGQQQSASANSIQNISYDQADSLVGIGLAHTILFEQGKAELSLLNVRAEQMALASTEHRDIAADSRDILAGMAIHVEEIRDGVVDTIVPRIKSIDNELVKVRKLVEAQ